MNYAITPQTMQKLEQQAFQIGLSPLLLMEEAARGVTDALVRLLHGASGKKVLLVCGTGNNGGDGLAVARMLRAQGCLTEVWLTGEPKTPQAQEELRHYEALAPTTVRRIHREEYDELIQGHYDAVVDALLGTGLNSAPRGICADAIALVYQLSAPMILSIDVPSGMDGATGKVFARKPQFEFEEDGALNCVCATHTVTLGYPKMGLYLTNQKDSVGELLLVPLMLPAPCETALMLERDDARVLEEKDLRSLIPPRSRDAHKGTCGRVLLFAGTLGMAGAAAMAAKAALLAGAGLVTIACPKEIIPILQTLVPNAMCVEIEQAAENPPAHDVLAAGCGIGRTKQAREWLVKLLKNEKAPTILDADALNLLAEEAYPLPKNVFLTPHVGEAARLLDIPAAAVSEDMIVAAKNLQARFGGTILLKSATTVIFDGVSLALNVTGSPALAKGGSGDALCGVLAALLCESEAFVSAQIACLWLGMAGKKAALRYGERSCLTCKVIDCLGECLL